jgi:cyclohexyl-isocyanide hydratase
MMEDEALLQFLRTRAADARYVTSVCTGALVLGAAGLLQGYRATTHWLSQDILVLFGAEPVDERVVIDRNRITGGGVTAGIDFGLAVAAQVFGPAVAQEVQLVLEYDPAPPFNGGSPKTALPAIVQEVIAAREEAQSRRRAIAERAAARLGLAVRGSRASEIAG